MRTSLGVRALAALNATVLVMGLIAAAAVAGPSRHADRPAMALLTLRGSADIVGVEGRRLLGPGEHELAVGEVVEMATGDAVLALVGGGSLEVRSAGPGAESSRVALSEVPTVLGGDVLVVAGRRALSVDAGVVRLTVADGAARLSRSTVTTFAVYEGRATVAVPGDSLSGGLLPLRQVVIPDDGTLPAPQPLRFAEVADPWERRFLGDVIDLQDTLEGRSQGFTTSLRRDFIPDVFFYQALLPGLVQEPAFDQARIEGGARSVGETLVGAAIALTGERDDFARRWQATFALRDAGAGWGVVAFDQGASRASLLAALDGAVERSPLLFRAPSPVPVFRPALPPPPSPRAVRATPPARPPTRGAEPVPGSPPPRPPGSVTVVPSPPSDPPGDGGLLNPVVDPVVDLLDGVLDGLDRLTGGLL